MPTPKPDLIDDENPEWTDEEFAASISFSELPAEMRELLGSPHEVVPDAEPAASRVTAA
jgi:hypothetical protein